MRGYIVTRLMDCAEVNGTGTKFQNEGLLGVMMIFDTRKRAIEWAHGDKSLVVVCLMKDKP